MKPKHVVAAKSESLPVFMCSASAYARRQPATADYVTAQVGPLIMLPTCHDISIPVYK